jgi:hypothetical protein
MNMHSVDCETSTGSDVEIASYFIHPNQACKITSFMTLT